MTCVRRRLHNGIRRRVKRLFFFPCVRRVQCARNTTATLSPLPPCEQLDVRDGYREPGGKIKCRGGEYHKFVSCTNDRGLVRVANVQDIISLLFKYVLYIKRSRGESDDSTSHRMMIAINAPDRTNEWFI